MKALKGGKHQGAFLSFSHRDISTNLSLMERDECGGAPKESSCNQGRISFYAAEICRRGLGVPAIFILEAYKPLVVLAGSGITAAFPLLLPLLGMKRYRELVNLLSDRETVEMLIREIEFIVARES
ncbi:MAG: hypothetical protein D6808_01095 [Candidatus Dadabacteria bacterium]|nr:MAG: hypothetical protein D6808_01095 [Candidatus Dadabacteria bacterium]